MRSRSQDAYRIDQVMSPYSTGCAGLCIDSEKGPLAAPKGSFLDRDFAWSIVLKSGHRFSANNDTKTKI
jgi:hypothetical protein